MLKSHSCNNEERFWEHTITWTKPQSESAKCWFVSNAGVEDKTVQPKFMLRSLATLRVFLKNTRIATSQRIRNEYERRLLMNQEVVEVLRSNCQLWTLVDGPCVEYLSEPSEEALDRANGAKARLLLMRTQDAIPVSAAQIIDEMIRAVNTLVSADFERIRIEQKSDDTRNVVPWLCEEYERIT